MQIYKLWLLTFQAMTRLVGWRDYSKAEIKYDDSNT